MKKLNLMALTIATSFMLMSFTGTVSPVKSLSSGSFYNTSKVSWLKEIHDFGEIPQGKPVSIAFSFTNTGTEPLLIANVATSCGCTASEYSKEPIAPGASSSIWVTYSAAAMGAFSKTITVNFSDATVNKVLQIKGTVK